MLAAWVFDWNALVAIGTLALAGVTAVVVVVTLRTLDLQGREVKAVEDQTAALTDQAEATKRQVDVSIASLEASSRPVLVGFIGEGDMWRASDPADMLSGMVGLRFHDDHYVLAQPYQVYFATSDDRIYCSIPLRNVGAGVAFVQRVELLTSRTGVENHFPLTGRVTNVIVPRDEATQVLFAAVRKQGNQASEWEEIVNAIGRELPRFKIRVTYTGASREMVTVTEVETSKLPNGSYIYTSQEVWNGEGEDRRLLVSTENVQA